MMRQALVSVTPAGLIAFTMSFDSATAKNRLLTVIDTTGRIVSRFGKLGDGPGELGMGPWFITLTDSSIIAFTLGPPRYTELRVDGSEIFTSLNTEDGVPFHIIGDSADIFPISELANSQRPMSHLARVSTHTTRGRHIVDTTNASYVAFVQSPADTSRSRLLLNASASARLALANPRTRAITIFTIDGVLVHQFTGPPGIHRVEFDNRDRLWVFSSALAPTASDSTLITVYEGSTSLGARTVPCPALTRVSLRLPFLAVLCQVPPDRKQAELELLIYRVTEPRP
jgi:hypothetical protein